jgi:hypothetical protein
MSQVFGDQAALSLSVIQLAFVGLETSRSWSPLVSCADVSTDSTPHPHWCRDRREQRKQRIVLPG